MAYYKNAIDPRATFITLMLREDHQKVNQLFDQFTDSTNTNDKRNIVTAALAALEIHATIEEELIYPAWEEYVARSLTDEALDDHYVVHALIKELKKISPEDQRYNTNFMVLSEHIRHHMKEEEGKMFPLAEKAAVDWDRLTKQVIERRQRLEQKNSMASGSARDCQRERDRLCNPERPFLQARIGGP